MKDPSRGKSVKNHRLIVSYRRNTLPHSGNHLGFLAAIVLLVIVGVDAVCLDAVRLGGVVGLAEYDRVLASSTGADNLLATDGGVVDKGGSVDIVDSALAGLVVAREAPGEDLALGGDGKAVVGTGSDGDGVLDVCNLLATCFSVHRKSTYRAGQ